jgi:hypothetical protein
MRKGGWIAIQIFLLHGCICKVRSLVLINSKNAFCGTGKAHCGPIIYPGIYTGKTAFLRWMETTLKYNYLTASLNRVRYIHYWSILHSIGQCSMPILFIHEWSATKPHDAWILPISSTASTTAAQHQWDNQECFWPVYGILTYQYLSQRSAIDY